MDYLHRAFGYIKGCFHSDSDDQKTQSEKQVQKQFKESASVASPILAGLGWILSGFRWCGRKLCTLKERFSSKLQNAAPAAKKTEAVMHRRMSGGLGEQGEQSLVEQIQSSTTESQIGSKVKKQESHDSDEGDVDVSRESYGGVKPKTQEMEEERRRQRQERQKKTKVQKVKGPESDEDDIDISKEPYKGVKPRTEKMKEERHQRQQRLKRRKLAP